MKQATYISTGVFRRGAIAMAVAAASAAAVAQVPPTLDELRNSNLTGRSDADTKAAEERNLRAKAMRESAMSYGARSGLLRRSYELRKSLERTAQKLDAIYNFTPLMLTDLQLGEVGDGRGRSVVPPVIVESGPTFNQESETLIRYRGNKLRIESNARFAPVPPNWRDYLLRDLGERQAALPHASLLPRTPQERSDWDSWVAEGFAAGRSQADSIFDVDLARLERDIKGMIRYHELVDQKVVSLPFVAVSNRSVTGDGNQLNINDILLKITVMPQFQTDPERWTPTGITGTAN